MDFARLPAPVQSVKRQLSNEPQSAGRRFVRELRALFGAGSRIAPLCGAPGRTFLNNEPVGRCAVSEIFDGIENRTFDELKVGDTASLACTLTHKDMEQFAIMARDINPAHLDEAFAKSDTFHKVVAHGMWGGALFSTVLGTQLPGPGAKYVEQRRNMSSRLCTSANPLAWVTRSPSP